MERVKGEQAKAAVEKACDAGDAMVKAIDAVVNLALREGGVEDGLQIGVGIDIGDIVATNIGLGKAHELTAYGSCVNNCCKRSFGNNAVILTHDAMRMFPSEPGGRTRFQRYPGVDDAYVLHYPDDYQTLA